ncbi:YtzI protein [Virgibacillus sediminis]|uniref:YtzI protein n=1 Tax=Virgibacillus sediminis TaxID=202260 RepID=A0ABV7A4A8_9BACI
MYITAAVVISALVLVLSLLTISKGYEYKHTIDPHPNEKNDEEKNEK